MPRQEQPVPWVATQAADREPHPRKNVYFAGDLMEEVFDYCTWQAHVAGYLTLRGRRARGTSELICDVLARAYLKAMLEPTTAQEYAQWRSAEYELKGRCIQPLPPQQVLIVDAGTVSVLSAAGAGKTQPLLMSALSRASKRGKRESRRRDRIARK